MIHDNSDFAQSSGAEGGTNLSVVKREWARGYKAGKRRARYEVLTVIVALYFIVVLIGKLASS